MVSHRINGRRSCVRVKGGAIVSHECRGPDRKGRRKWPSYGPERATTNTNEYVGLLAAYVRGATRFSIANGKDFRRIKGLRHVFHGLRRGLYCDLGRAGTRAVTMDSRMSAWPCDRPVSSTERAQGAPPDGLFMHRETFCLKNFPLNWFDAIRLLPFASKTNGRDLGTASASPGTCNRVFFEEMIYRLRDTRTNH